MPFNEVDKTEYYTLSRHGITYWGLTENYFTKLDIWLVEYNKYSKLRDVSIENYYSLMIIAANFIPVNLDQDFL